MRIKTTTTTTTTTVTEDLLPRTLPFYFIHMEKALTLKKALALLFLLNRKGFCLMNSLEFNEHYKVEPSVFFYGDLGITREEIENLPGYGPEFVERAIEFLISRELGIK